MKAKKITARFSFLVGSDQTRIEIEDDSSSIRFCQLKLTPQELSKVLSRQADVECEAEVVGLDKVGKIMQNKNFQFEISEEQFKNRYKSESISKELQEVAQKALNENAKGEGWIAGSYFGSKGSFIQNDGRFFASTIIRRWVDSNGRTSITSELIQELEEVKNEMNIASERYLSPRYESAKKRLDRVIEELKKDL